MFHYSSYWRSWSRVLSTDHPHGPFVEVDFTPIGGGVGADWSKVRSISIRTHCTPRDAGDIDQDILPDEVWDEMVKGLGYDIAYQLVSEDFLSQIDWDLHKRHSNGGCPLALCTKKAV